MENTNNRVDVAVASYDFNLFHSDDEHPRNLIEINVRRMLQIVSRDPQVTPLVVEQPTVNIRIQIPEEIESLPPWFDSFFLSVFIWIDMTHHYDLESSQIDSLASELANYTRNRVIPDLHSSDATSFHLIADLTTIRDYDHDGEILPANEMEEEEEEEEDEEEETERGSGVPEFVLERLMKSSFRHEEMPMTMIGVGDECSVCLQEFCDAKNVSKLITCLPCGHVFHQECILRWLQGQNSCPYCRGRVE